MARTLTPRPTTYKGTKMRSRLEAGFAQWLDQLGCPWEYEPECFADETGQYLPDFLVRNVLLLSPPLRYDAYLEIKPTATLDQAVELLEGPMARVLSSQPPLPDTLPAFAGHGGYLTAVVSKALADDQGQLLVSRYGTGALRLHRIARAGHGRLALVEVDGVTLGSPWAGPWRGEWWRSS